MSRRIVALLGRKDEPTDAVEEYSRYVGESLRACGLETETTRVKWAEQGWSTALSELRKKTEAWRGGWVMLQYTALAWSQRGFPLKVLRVLDVLRAAKVRTGIVFHDVEPYGGKRPIDKLRRAIQLYVMRQAVRRCDLAICTIPLEKISWLPKNVANATFIPVGANFLVEQDQSEKKPANQAPTVAVYGVTGGSAGEEEMKLIAGSIRLAAARTGKLKLVVLGRNSQSAETKFRQALCDIPIEVEVRGLLPPEQVAAAIASADVLLFVRGPISSRRSSAISGIACGVPVIAFAGPETAPPVTDAGVAFVSNESPAEIGNALVRILTDSEYHDLLCEKSRKAQAEYFSWPAIAARYADVLQKEG